MKRPILLVMFCMMIAAGGASAAERGGPIRIGVLTDMSGASVGAVGLRDGLTALGYREDRDFVIGVRFTQGDVAALPTAARELVGRGVDIVFTDGRSAAKAAQHEIKKLPIVFAGGGNPVELGLIRSFARPGGNVTGVSDLDLELAAKRLEVFTEMIPGLKRVFFPYGDEEAYSRAEANAYRDAGRNLKIAVIDKPARSEEAVKTALAMVKKGEIHGMLAPRTTTLNIPGYIRETGARLALPTMFASVFFAENGGLASYTPHSYESGRMAARIVDKIVKGADPGAIPVEVNNKIELVVNLKTAGALGIKIAPEVLSRANRVIR